MARVYIFKNQCRDMRNWWGIGECSYDSDDIAEIMEQFPEIYAIELEYINPDSYETESDYFIVESEDRENIQAVLELLLCPPNEWSLYAASAILGEFGFTPQAVNALYHVEWFYTNELLNDSGERAEDCRDWIEENPKYMLHGAGGVVQFDCPISKISE